MPPLPLCPGLLKLHAVRSADLLVRSFRAGHVPQGAAVLRELRIGHASKAVADGFERGAVVGRRRAARSNSQLYLSCCLTFNSLSEFPYTNSLVIAYTSDLTYVLLNQMHQTKHTTLELDDTPKSNRGGARIRLTTGNTRMTISLPAEVRKRVRVFAAEDDTTQFRLIEQVVTDYVDARGKGTAVDHA